MDSIREIASGINQLGLRDHNERLVLTIIQRHGSMPAAEIARRTHLSAQTISVILRHLEHDGLVAKGTPLRGKVGKPSVPMTLATNGVFSWGVEIGRRCTNLVLLNFAGEVCHWVSKTYAYPTPASLIEFLQRELDKSPAIIDREEKIAGIGIASPFELWNWLDTVDAPSDQMLAWRDFSFTNAIAGFSSHNVSVANDATLACCAEHAFGLGNQFSDYAYFYIGTFAGGGIVLDDCVYSGQSGNAGAFGSMPVGNTAQANHQLIHNASIYLLENRLRDAGMEAAVPLNDEQGWHGFDEILTQWIDDTARHLAVACVSVLSVIDFEIVMIDGDFPAHVREKLVQRTTEHLANLDTQGIAPTRLCAGTIGTGACAMGAAYQPIVQNYFLQRTSFAS